MNFQPGFNQYSNPSANVNLQFTNGAAAAAAGGYNQNLQDDLHQVAREAEIFRAASRSRGREWSAAEPVAYFSNQSYRDGLHQVAGQADMIRRGSMAAHGGAAAAASVSNQDYRIDFQQAARQADMIRRSSMAAHGGAAAAAAVPNQSYHIDLYQAARQADMIRLNAMAARSEAAAAASISNHVRRHDLQQEARGAEISQMTAVENRPVYVGALNAALVTNRLSVADYIKICSDAEISQLIGMSAMGKYIDALHPGSDPSWASIFAGVVYGRVDVLRMHLEGGPNLSAAQGGAVVTPMQAAARANAMTREGFTALMLAAKSGSFDILEILLKAGANVDAVDATGTNALMLAASTGKCNVVAALLEKNPILNRANNEGNTALMMAARNGNLAVLTLLVKAEEAFEANMLRARQDRNSAMMSQNSMAMHGYPVPRLAVQRDDARAAGALPMAGEQFDPVIMRNIPGPLMQAGNVNASLAGLAYVNASAVEAPSARIHIAQNNQPTVLNALATTAAQTHAASVNAAAAAPSESGSWHAAAGGAGDQAGALPQVANLNGSGMQLFDHANERAAISADSEPAGASADGSGFGIDVPSAASEELQAKLDEIVNGFYN